MRAGTCAGSATQVPALLITASIAVSASFAETASFAQNAATASFIEGFTASLQSGSLVPGKGIDIQVSGSAQVISSDKETFLTFFDSQPAIGIIRNQVFSLIECEPESRKQLDLTNYIQARISVQVVDPGTTSSVAGFEFSTDGGSSFSFLDGLSGPTASLASTGSMTSSYVDLSASAMDDILIRWVVLGGSVCVLSIVSLKGM